jgi:hypothetical protein
MDTECNSGDRTGTASHITDSQKPVQLILDKTSLVEESVIS